MRSLRVVALAALSLWTFASCIQAQEIEWQQTLNLPVGSGLPEGLQVDVLGITVGDNLDVARARLEQLRAESPGAPALRETQTQYALNTPGGVISATFVGEISLKRKLPDVASGEETITIRLTAPSSGNQVIAIERQISYQDQADQIRIGSLLDALTGKFGSAPEKVDPQTYAILYRYQFDNGARTKAQDGGECNDFAKTWHDQDTLNLINPQGNCDVVFDVVLLEGISTDHARAVTFRLYDNDRAKANLTADFAFFSDYINGIQNQTGGATPKL